MRASNYRDRHCHESSRDSCPNEPAEHAEVYQTTPTTEYRSQELSNSYIAPRPTRNGRPAPEHVVRDCGHATEAASTW